MKDISNQSVFTDEDAVFECEIKINYPEITLSWYKGTQKLDTGDKYNISISGDCHLLRIKKCQLSDQGNYRVVCGPHISSTRLTVMGQYQGTKPLKSVSEDLPRTQRLLCGVGL